VRLQLRPARGKQPETRLQRHRGDRGALLRGEHDIIVTKKQWGAFYGTDLDLQLRRRGIRTVVLGGISTNMGVESTARAAHEHGYNVVLAEDATSARSADAHRFAYSEIFPLLGRVASSEEVIRAIAR
jgi:nicotinamidase-related amidase